MLNVEELRQRLLAELEEAQQGEVPTTLNVVLLNERDADNAEYLEHLRAAVHQLVNAGFLRLANGRNQAGYLVDLSAEESLAELERGISVLRFDRVGGLWIDDSISGPPYAPATRFFVLTPLGVEQSRQILQARGYQWWAPPPL